MPALKRERQDSSFPGSRAWLMFDSRAVAIIAILYGIEDMRARMGSNESRGTQGELQH